MEAASIETYGAPEMLAMGEVPDPVAGPEDLVIAVAAVGVNPADCKFRRGMFATTFPRAMPLVLGMDVAGTVVEVGAEVHGFSVGDRVFAMLPHTVMGGYAQLAAGPAAFFAPLPDGLDFVTAAAVPTPSTTGLELVEHDMDVQAGHRVLVVGAGGSVGRFAIHAAKQRGAHVAAAVRASRAGSMRQEVDSVVVTDAGGLDPDMLQTYDFIVDTVGGDTARGLLPLLREGGVLTSVSNDPVGDTPAGRDVTVRRFACFPDPDRLRAAASAIVSGAVALPDIITLPLAEAAMAHRMMEQSGTGKVVLVVPPLSAGDVSNGVAE